MSIPELFIKRPVMTTLITVAISIFGFMAYRSLSVSDLPNVDFPTIVVTASLPGANPEVMASSVATPMEQQFSTIAGIDSMTSVSSLGQSQVTIQFNLTRSLDGAALDVQSAISAVLRRLPQDLPTPPSFRKVNPADDPIIILVMSSNTLPLSEVDEYAENILAQRISTVNGVAQVQVGGSQKYAVRAQLNPMELAARGIGIDEVRTALAAGNVNMPTGTMNGSSQSLTLQATGQLQNATAYRSLIVAYRNGSPVRLGDLGTVIDSVQNDRVANWFMDARAITLQVQRQPGANTIEVVDGIKALLPSFRATLPASVNLDILIDKSLSIRESVDDVKFTLVLAIGLVVLVIFVFLRSLPATLIPSIAMPIAVVGTFGVMYFFDFSLDNLSLLALTLSVGFVVDDAIVMLENIIRHIELGESVMAASLKGSREIGFTIISMTISLVAVFIPVLFMGGVLGRLLHEFAVTISAAILVSGFVSLTLTPMLCSRFLKPIQHGNHSRLYNITEALFQASVNFYERTLKVSLKYRAFTMAIAGLMIFLTIWLIVIIPKGFIPTDDVGRIQITTEAAQDISFEGMVRHQRAVAAIVAQNPYVDAFNSSIGSGPGGASSGANTGRITIRLVDRKNRPTADKIVAMLRSQLQGTPGIKVFPQMPPTIRLGAQQTSSLYQFTLYGTDLSELYQTAPEFQTKLVRDVPGITDLTSDLQVTSPQLIVDIDRDKASTLGVTAQQIEDTLFNAFGTRQVSTIYSPSNQYFVILEVEPKYQQDPAALSLLYVRNSAGKLIPLEAVVHLKKTVRPLTVTHLGQLPAVTLSFNLKSGVSLSEVTDAIQKLAHELPSTVSTTFQGTAAAFANSLKGLGLLLIVAILVIYIVLGVLYEDFIHPITILSGLPSASFGALLTLFIFHEELNIYGYVGMIMLIGIVKKNAIMMIDFALEERKRGRRGEDAIFDACIVRFRPIMMTTLAALAGTLPIALGWGAGAESRRSLGLSVVGGLVVSQLLTLYITPVFYIYMEKLTAHFKKKAPVPAHHSHSDPVYAK